jgi:hypothetical protein
MFAKKSAGRAWNMKAGGVLQSSRRCISLVVGGFPPPDRVMKAVLPKPVPIQRIHEQHRSSHNLHSRKARKAVILGLIGTRFQGQNDRFDAEFGEIAA